MENFKETHISDPLGNELETVSDIFDYVFKSDSNGPNYFYLLERRKKASANGFVCAVNVCKNDVGIKKTFKQLLKRFYVFKKLN